MRNSLGTVKAEIALRPRREALDFYNLAYADLASQIRIALSSDKIGSFARGGAQEDPDIRLGTAWPSRSGEAGGPTRAEELSRVRAFVPSGETVSLLSLLQPIQSEAPNSIVHAGGKRALTVLAKTEDRAATDIMAALTPKLDALQKDWPAGYVYRVGGESVKTGETFASAACASSRAVIMFDSFAQAFILLTTVPFALTGTFLAFPALGMPFSFFAMVGVIALIGIVVNDGIVMVDTMNQHLAAGDSVPDASSRGCGRAAASDPDDFGDNHRRTGSACDRQPDVLAAVFRDHLQAVHRHRDLAVRCAGALSAADAEGSACGGLTRLIADARLPRRLACLFSHLPIYEPNPFP